MLFMTSCLITIATNRSKPLRVRDINPLVSPRVKQEKYLTYYILSLSDRSPTSYNYTNYVTTNNTTTNYASTAAR